ncbi:hypothetical protein SDC9_74903 [bioreactor metagenome]|uniref:Uncharacterized protein n=1 Tax=bioreactor metagenome TaxID=1076179 RepID=A0A644YKG9_9ZZZZ
MGNGSQFGGGHVAGDSSVFFHDADNRIQSADAKDGILIVVADDAPVPRIRIRCKNAVRRDVHTVVQHGMHAGKRGRFRIRLDVFVEVERADGRPVEQAVAGHARNFAVDGGEPLRAVQPQRRRGFFYDAAGEQRSHGLAESVAVPVDQYAHFSSPIASTALMNSRTSL